VERYPKRRRTINLEAREKGVNKVKTKNLVKRKQKKVKIKK